MDKKTLTKKTVDRLIDIAKSHGAEAADVFYVDNKQISANVRLGKLESVESSESQDFSLRVFIGKKSAIISSNNNTVQNIEEMAKRAVEMAKLSSEDPFSGLADPSLYPEKIIDLDLYDNYEANSEELINIAMESENAALEVKGIINSDGGSSSYSSSSVTLANTNGFYHEYKTSLYGVSACVVAKSGDSMEKDYEYCCSRYKSDLKDPSYIGKKAAERTLKRVNAKKIDTGKMPVIYDPRSATSLLSTFASAVNGESIALKKSFLQDCMNKKIFSDSINIKNNPLIKKGLASKPFDCEAVKKEEMFIIKDGKLENWFLDSHSAKKLGLTSNGCASRGLSSPPSPSCDNLYIENGTISKESLISDVSKGIYITQNFGGGINLLTGDFSQGGIGFMIENGKLTFPINEFTLSGNLKDIFLNITAANDLEYNYSINSPTLYVKNITIAGK